MEVNQPTGRPFSIRPDEFYSGKDPVIADKNIIYYHS